jgi:hypothetical protein
MIERRSLFTSILIFSLVMTAMVGGGSRAASGGEIAGTVADPRGAFVAGATVAVLDAAGQEARPATTTDARGQFRIENLPPGVYTLVVRAQGFEVARREQVKVEEGKPATIEMRLEVAKVEAGTVEVRASATKPNSDPVYQQLRRQGREAQDFASNAFTVNNLALKRDAAVFQMTGELYFLPPVEGRTVGAVFIGTGEMTLTPPVEYERRHLAIFTGAPELREQFSSLVLRFTDRTLEDVKASPQAAPLASPAQSQKARELYGDMLSLTRQRRSGFDARYNFDARTLSDLYAPERPGFFAAFIGGQRFKKLIYQIDPQGLGELSPEEVALLSYGESDWGVWAAFHREQEYAKGTASADEDHRLYDILRHEIDGAIRGTQLAASDRITLRMLKAGGRVLPFDLFRNLRVSRVTDEAGRDLEFIQEDRDNDADFAVILPTPPKQGEELKLTVQYQGGDTLRDSGAGNYILVARSTWYPNNPQTQFGDRAAFNMTFRYPKGHAFVGTGAPIGEDGRDGDQMISKWSSGNTELAVAGFNYGRFKRKATKDAETGYDIEFYANSEVPNELRELQLEIERLEAAGMNTGTTLGSISTAGMADSAIADAQNATRIYNAFFGKLPYTRIAMTQQPAANFGQAWPTLVYMPYIAFINTTQRQQLLGTRGATSTFWRYVGPHEVAHQWWGHIVGWKSYRDQWMSEGFAEFSTSLYAQYVRRDIDKFIDFWEEQRMQIVQGTQLTEGKRPYKVGGVTQGWRLNSGKTGIAYQNLVYPKGAYILHMLRMMMYDPKTRDARFQAMMKDFVQTYYNKDVSTEDFKRIVEKHITPSMNINGDGRMDWFFNQWVYGTEIPAYKLDYKIEGDVLSGRIIQSGVPDDFRMVVPLYLDFGQGWVRLGQAVVTGSSSVDLGQIKLPPGAKRAAVCALKDVLATSIDNGKK